MKIDKVFLRTLILYGIIGGISAGLDALSFLVLYKSLGINEFVSNIISVHLGIFLSFFLNSRYNFRKTDQFKRRFLSFYITGLFGLGLSSFLLYIGNLLRMDVMLSKIISIVIVALVQFLINRVFAFGDR